MEHVECGMLLSCCLEVRRPKAEGVSSISNWIWHAATPVAQTVHGQPPSESQVAVTMRQYLISCQVKKKLFLKGFLRKAVDKMKEDGTKAKPSNLVEHSL